MATNEIKFKSDVSVFGNFNVDSFSVSKLETTSLPALTVDGAIAYDSTKESLVVYDLVNTEWVIPNASIIQEDNLSIRPAGQVPLGAGNPRGIGSVDLQTARTNLDQIAGGKYDVISGGQNNKTDSVNQWAEFNVIGGGSDNEISFSYAAVIAGGQGNTLSSSTGVIGGGSFNEIYAGWQNSIFSGQNNYIGAGPGNDNGQGNYIASGYYNSIGNQLGEQTINYNSICGGGSDNWIDAGEYNTLGGGLGNKITKTVSTSSKRPSYNTMMGGGYNEIYDGDYSAIVGGSGNVIRSNYSFVYGNNGEALNDGVVLFSDSSDDSFQDVAANSFNIQASGGLRLVDGNEGVGKVLTCDANGTGHWADVLGANVITSSTAPSSPDEGDLWFDSSSAVLYIYYTDTNGVSQWITTSTAGYSFGSDGDGSGIVNSIIAGNGIIVDSNDPINPVVSVEGISTSGTAPTSPADGDLWFDSDNGLLYIYYAEDGGSSQWVTASPQGPKGDTGPAGADGAIGATGPAGADGADGSIGATGPAGEFEDITSMSVIGNVTGSTAAPSEVSLISETNTIAGNDNDTTIPTSAAVKDYVDSMFDGVGESVTGTATFTNSTNNIALAGVGSLTGLAVGDVIEVTGSASNNDVFTVETITDTGNVIVNAEHAGGTTTKSLTDETVSATVTLVCKAKNAPLGYGQGWVDVTRAVDTEYTNTTGRTICYAIRAGTQANGTSGYITVSVDNLMVDISQTAGTSQGYNVAVRAIIPNGSVYERYSSPLISIIAYQRQLR
jgi:hypothetical protein